VGGSGGEETPLWGWAVALKWSGGDRGSATGRDWRGRRRRIDGVGEEDRREMTVEAHKLS
jgi:hypothetical protein